MRLSQAHLYIPGSFIIILFSCSTFGFFLCQARKTFSERMRVSINYLLQGNPYRLLMHWRWLLQTCVKIFLSALLSFYFLFFMHIADNLLFVGLCNVGVFKCPLLFQTVRLWQGSEDGNYECRHIMKDHDAELNLVLSYSTWSPSD